MSYTYEESKAILRHPAVHASMSRLVHGREITPVTRGPAWRFADRDNCTSPFTLLAACVERAVAEAVVVAADRDHERLMLLLHMTANDDVEKVAKAVATAVENYAVEMQFGAEGVQSYREHVAANAPK